MFGFEEKCCLYYANQKIGRKKPAPQGAGLTTTNGFTELFLRYSAH